MAKKTFEHTFDASGTVTWRSIEGATKGKPSHEKHYEHTMVGPDVHALAYLGSSGYTLSVVLDFRTGRLVAFASNEKSLVLQHGTFEVVEATEEESAGSRARPTDTAHAHSPR
jgi:hypothetical protein